MQEQTELLHQDQKIQLLEQQIQAASAISNSLLYSLERRHLNISLDTAQFIQPVSPARIVTEETFFLRVDRIGSGGAGTSNLPFTAIQTALSACHLPGQYTLIFLVANDGQNNSIYFGLRSHDFPLYPTEDFAANLGSFLQGNLPGTKLSLCEMNDFQLQKDVINPLKKQLRSAFAITGIPSLKPDDNPGAPQSLDRLLRGMRGHPFIYMVVAEPFSVNEVDDILFRTRNMAGQIHTLTKMNFTTTDTVSALQNEAKSFSKCETAGETDSWTDSHSKTKSESQTEGHTFTKGINLSVAEALATEYINTHAEAAETHIKRYIERFEKSRAMGCWNVGVYLLTDRLDTAQQGGIQLRALLSGEKSEYEPIRIHDLKRFWAKGVRKSLQNYEQLNLALVNQREDADNNVILEQVEHPLGFAFSRLTTPLNTEELALLVNLPQREVAGVPFMSTADFSLNVARPRPEDVILGHLLEGGESTSLAYSISQTTLTKHTLITGITGSGKSTTCRHLLNELRWRQVPFLIIEPAKDEYVEWAMHLNATLPPDSPERINIYMPGVQSWRGQKLDQQLHINPFDIVWLAPDLEPQILAHIDRLKSILNASFPMQEALPILLEDVLFQAYTRPHDWLAETLPAFNTSRPTLTQLLDHIIPTIRGKGYEDRVTANLTAALTTRVQSLRRGWKKQVFDRPASTPWATLFDQSTVINLSQMGDDADKAFAMSLLLQFLYEYRQASHLSGGSISPQTLKHLTLIEEAHRIMLRVGERSADQANPQAKVAEMFSNILSEIRAYGEGLLIADQVPARLIPDAVKNTNLKIVHRLVANDDREAIGGCMALTLEQMALINRLRPGQAIVYSDLDDMAAWVQVPDANQTEKGV